MELNIKDTIFKTGRPQVAVSLTGKTPVEIVTQCMEAAMHPVDVIEWRADYYFDAMNDADSKLASSETYMEMAKILDDINLIAENRPIIFTIRTEKQGGLGALSDAQMAGVQQFVAQTGLADLIDVEIAGPNPASGGLDDQELADRIELIHGENCKVLLSYHDFDAMMKPEAIVRLIQKMHEAGADMCKVAAMANSREDSMGLLKATAYLTKNGIGPVVTMAMGAEGVITRIVGGKYGSVMTFASVGEASAPGQLSADMMKKKLDDFYEA